MKRLASTVLTLLALHTPAFAATSGQITDPTITDDGATVSAQNLSLTLNDAGCGGTLGPTRCGGLAGVLDSASSCPEPLNGLPAEITTLWETDLATDHYSPWSPSSGPVSVQVTPAHAYRICLYARYTTDQGQKYVTLQASAVVTSLYNPPTACEQAQDRLDAAKAKLRKLRHRNAPPQKIKRATRKMKRAADAVAAACP